jgi:hypothetical protein
MAGAGPGRRTGTRLLRIAEREARLPAPGAGNDDGAVTEVLIFSTVVALLGIVVWIVLLLWAAR